MIDFDWNKDFTNIIETTVKDLLKKAEKETNADPTPEQAKAGNYKKGRVTIQGLEIAIENPKGSYRKGVDANGKEWKNKMNNTYGYFVQTKAIDGDAVDVFIGSSIMSDKVFCIDQYNGNEFDETKVMLGFTTAEYAKKAYLSNYEPGWKGCKYITELDIDTFKMWLNNRKEKKQRKPVHFYKSLIKEENLLKESLGVRDGLTPIAKEITNRILENWKMGITVISGMKIEDVMRTPYEELEIFLPYKGEIEIRDVGFIGKMSVGFKLVGKGDRLTNSFVDDDPDLGIIKSTIENNKMIMPPTRTKPSTKPKAPPKITRNMFISSFQDKNELMTLVLHELKHVWDYYIYIKKNTNFNLEKTKVYQVQDKIATYIIDKVRQIEKEYPHKKISDEELIEWYEDEENVFTIPIDKEEEDILDNKIRNDLFVVGSKPLKFVPKDDTVQKLFYYTGETKELEAFTQESWEQMLSNGGKYRETSLWEKYMWLVEKDKELNPLKGEEYINKINFYHRFYPSSWSRDKVEKDIRWRLKKGIRDYVYNIGRLRARYDNPPETPETPEPPITENKQIISSVISPYHGVIGSAAPGSEEYEIGVEISEGLNINNIVKDILFEGKESKNLSKARNYLKNIHSLTQEKAQLVLDNIRHLIHNSRIENCKYMTGLARMAITNQLSDQITQSNMNKTLKLLEGHTDYNEDLNGLSATELINRFQTAVQEDLEKDKETQKQYSNTNTDGNYNGYKIVPINDFDDAKQYSFGVNWCITESESSFETYTKNGLARFYFLLKNRYEFMSYELHDKEGSDPLDEYGLSKIAISVNEDGSLNSSTLRRNHNFGANDNMLTTGQISKLINANFYEVFKPYSKEELIERKEKLKFFRPDNLNELIRRDKMELDDLEQVGERIVSRIIYKNRCNYITPDEAGEIVDNNGKRYSVVFSKYESGFTGWMPFNKVNKCLILVIDKTYNIGRVDGTMIFNNWTPCEYKNIPKMDNNGYTVFPENIMKPNEEFIFKHIKPYHIKTPNTLQPNGIYSTNPRYTCYFVNYKHNSNYEYSQKEMELVFDSGDNKFLTTELDRSMDIETGLEYLSEWYNNPDGFGIAENTIKNMTHDYLNEIIALSPVKQQAKDDADRGKTLRTISFEEDDDNVDPEDRIEEIDEHKLDLLIDIINNKISNDAEAFLVFKYVLVGGVNINFLEPAYIAKVNDAMNMIKNKLVTQKSKVNAYNFLFNQVDQTNMTGAQKQELRDIMSSLSNVPDTRAELTKNVMESFAPILFKDGEKQKLDFEEHLKSLSDDIGIKDIVEELFEDNQRLKGKVFQIPDKLYLELKNKYNQVKDNPEYTTYKNYKRLQNIVERGGEITYKWMYTLVDWRDNYTGVLGGEKQDKDAWLISAEKLMKWVDEELEQATKSVKQAEKTASKVGAIAHTQTKFRTVESMVRDIISEDYQHLFEMAATDIHQTYYPNLPEDIFTQIASADEITTNLTNNKLGKYAKWLLWLYTDKKKVKNQLKLEDLYKAKEYIPMFDRLSKSKKLKNNDLNSYLSLSDMYIAIKPFLDGEESVSKGEEIRQVKHEGAEKLYEDDKFTVIHPKTKEAAIYYGKNTQWCTSATENNMFDHYNSDGPLYIIIDKRENTKYQFHFEVNQFMDANDVPIERPIMETIWATGGLYQFFEGLVGVHKMLKLEYENVDELDDGTFLVDRDERKFLLDANGEALFYEEYDEIEALGNGRYLVFKTDNGYGVVDQEETELIPCGYDYLAQAGENFIVESDSRYGVIDINNNELIPLIYMQMECINDEGTRFRIKGRTDKWGIIDLETDTKIPPEYDAIQLDAGGMSRAQKNGKVGVLDSNGQVVIPITYNFVYPSTDGVTYRVYDHLNREGVINIKNEIVEPFEYKKSDEGLTPNEYISRGDKGNYGVITADQKIIIPFIYSRIGAYNRYGVYIVKDTNEKMGVLSRNGEVIIPVEYDTVYAEEGNMYVARYEMFGEKLYFDLNGNRIEKPKN